MWPSWKVSIAIFLLVLVIVGFVIIYVNRWVTNKVDSCIEDDTGKIRGSDVKLKKHDKQEPPLSPASSTSNSPLVSDEDEKGNESDEFDMGFISD